MEANKKKIIFERPNERTYTLTQTAHTYTHTPALRTWNAYELPPAPPAYDRWGSPYHATTKKKKNPRKLDMKLHVFTVDGMV